MKPRGTRRLLLTVAVLHCGLLADLHAQLVLEPTQKRLRAGETIELFLRGRDPLQDIHEVRFDDQVIPFDLVRSEVGEEADRVRIRIPSSIKPGPHEIVVLFSDTATRVPEILGLTLGEAQRKLEEGGLVLDGGAFRPGPSDVVVPTVTRQDPLAGTKVRKGTRVAVEIARMTEVPEILDLSLDEAARRLAQCELELDFPTAPPGAVIRTQDPVAGATALAGTRVAVELAVEVPDLVGRGIDLARPMILASGLLPEVVIREAADGPFETVLVQQPAAGLPVPPGTAVRVVIESRPDLPAPRWPWPWLALTGLLTSLLYQRVRVRRAVRKSYRVEAHDDLDGLRASTTPPAWEGRELRLDVRLLGCPDPGRQTIYTDGPLAVEEPGR